MEKFLVLTNVTLIVFAGCLFALIFCITAHRPFFVFCTDVYIALYNLVMKTVGVGYQYRVYDLRNGRVLKKRVTFFETFLRFFLWSSKKFFFVNILERVRCIEKITNLSIEGLKKKLYDIDTTIIGNPCFIDDLNYEQDKVIVVQDFLKTHSMQENRKIIDGYIENVLSVWCDGYSDATFQLTRNYGVNHCGRIILIDIGELAFSKKEVAEHIRERVWLKKEFYKDIKDTLLQSYYKEMMDRYITLENLEAHWGINRSLVEQPLLKTA